jgi:hypothetical protein
MEEGQLLIVVYVRSSKDLPKTKGIYFCCRSGFMTVQEIDPSLPEKSYLREIRWYLQPTDIVNSVKKVIPEDDRIPCMDCNLPEKSCMNCCHRNK